MIDRTAFPEDFTWGVATSSYQIEGSTDADGAGPSIWSTFCAEPGRIVDGSDGAVACDHYRRWQADLDLIEDLGVGAYRFSLSWPRILPEGTGRVEQRGLDFYDRLVDGLLERGIEPWATLYHWDLPQALQDAGGWPERAVAHAFADYADVVTARLGDRVRAWTTLNEPWCSAFLGYESGEHAPGLRSRRQHLQASHNLLLAHGLALPRMRRNAPGSLHGIVLNLNPAYPASAAPADVEAARRFDGFFNRWYLDPVLRGAYPADVWEGYGQHVPRVEPGDLELIGAPIDFLGVNYYSRTVVTDAPGDPWPATRDVGLPVPRTAMGWEVRPQALTELLLRLRRDYRLPPVHITENGAAYDDVEEDGVVSDPERVDYLRAHVAAVADAAAAGAPVAGYFAWSLLDNFEWAQGYTRRFGLVHVDFANQRRSLKGSARWYQRFLAGG
ncbi:MAG: beta-glucosidase [Trueperaceae bacterium]|nr:beta-glucosidase [Trueperaceae bacterium]MCO5174368.1 GH1 family beta-glucosidase [Trueperaceae bacterium]MCW5819986.1 beta-glucosidase [Trueperaceae bacterium]